MVSNQRPTNTGLTKWREVVDISLFFAILASFGLLVSVGVLLTYQIDLSGRIAQTASEERARLERYASILGSRINDIVGDLRLVGNSEHLQSYLAKSNSSDIASMKRDLSIFIESKMIYDQARFIDETGMERVRVDLASGGKSKVISDEKLQNKGDRYFFTDTMKLPAGEIFVSPFDLNIEGSQIEVPHKPMIRFAVPLFENDGKRRGIAILNYLGNDLLNRMDEKPGSQLPPVQLLNRDGYWLKNEVREREWGFMFNHKETFETDYPQVWKNIQESVVGQVQQEGRLWSWHRIYALPKALRSSTGSADASGISAANIASSDYYWIAVSSIPMDVLSPQQHNMIVRYGGLWAFALTLIAFGSWAVALRQGQLKILNERLVAALEELEFLASHDPMTGTLNRRAFFSRAEIERARAIRSGKPIAILASDIDYFKNVNDTHGHHVGDLVIKDFSDRVGAMLRPPDILARFGGEEFFILLPDTDIEAAKKVAERIRQEIEIQRDPVLPKYTVSQGVAVSNGKAGSSVDLKDLLGQADAALYCAKHGGRNRVETGINVAG